MACMEPPEYRLRYDGQEFDVSDADYKRLAKVYKNGLAVSGILFRFTPIGGDAAVEIGIGSGAQFVITEKPARREER